MNTVLDVHLGPIAAGTIELSSSGERIFRFSGAYLDLPTRPVLGQWFEDKDLDSPFTGREALPDFFANLLPQGQLRKYLSGRLGLRERQDFYLLGALGRDLPGAVRVDFASPNEISRRAEHERRRQKLRPPVDDWHYFSLAGFQIKFSMSDVEGRLTLPSRTATGRYIVKLPDVVRPNVNHQDLPESEWSMLEWARRSGLDVPAARLEPLTNVQLAYDELPALNGTQALVVTRFDRDGERRIHQEDFAQVFGVDPDDKYAERSAVRRQRAHHFESVAALLHAVDPGCSREFIRRLVFMILSGNEDAHLKNWALLYDDEGVRARLSPAYDLLCTIAYQGNASPRLALRIAGENDARQVTGQSFAGIAEKLGERLDTVLAWIIEDVERMRACYASDSAHWPLPSVAREALDRHLGSLPLASGRAR
ncbi:type II toxin-antitoxin system HipA family toxin [Sorangium sp. So ce388]|uniref:type II toxin-antitoxin system HipA family toxin n=1 Tax=Sorangium sp. So ce388 TaxID=3133309 RepID=UPI003F5C7079